MINMYYLTSRNMSSIDSAITKNKNITEKTDMYIHLAEPMILACMYCVCI